MLKTLTASTALVAMLAIGGLATAQTTPKANPGAAAKMTSAECQSLWGTLDSSKAGNVTEAQAKPYVTSFQAVDTNGDGKLTQAEFEAGCSSGLVSSTASSGAGSGSMPKR